MQTGKQHEPQRPAPKLSPPGMDRSATVLRPLPDGARADQGHQVTAAMVLEEGKDEWFEDARLAILRLSITEETFTADTLRTVMRPAPNRYWTGLAFTQARNAGLIEWVDYEKSKTKSRKGSPVSIWRRKINEGVAAA